MPGVVEGLSEIYRSWDCPDLKEWEVDDRECFLLTRKLWAKGFPVGPSSGLNLAASMKVAAELGPECKIVTVFPDRMERYFSHKVFEPFTGQSRDADQIDAPNSLPRSVNSCGS